MALGRPAPGAFETIGVGGTKKNGIVWTSNPFFGNGRAAQLILGMQAGLAAFTKGFAARVQAYARENAPWEDRTGDARRGLTALGEQRLVKYTITLFHTVEYGIWLEVRWSGRLAIIDPTIRVMGEQMMQELQMDLLALSVGRALV